MSAIQGINTSHQAHSGSPVQKANDGHKGQNSNKVEKNEPDHSNHNHSANGAGQGTNFDMTA